MLTDRFWAKVEKTETCWNWTASRDRDGYGTFFMGDQGKVGAHRASYQFAGRAVPDGLELDHLCRNRACVNPDHLEPVTHAENVRRRAAAQAYCKHGHEFTPENTYIPAGRSGRQCRACQRAAVARYAARRAAKRVDR